MRRIATIILMTVIVLGLGSVAYGYVANQRGLWPFHNATITATTSSFSNLVGKDLGAYGYFDLSNPDVLNKIGNNPELVRNVNLLKAGLKQLSNTSLQESTPMVWADDATRQEISTKSSELLDYLSSKKVHIAWDPNITPAIQQDGQDVAAQVLLGVEINGADDASHTLVTLKSFLGESNQSSQEIRILNQPVSVITSGSTTPQNTMSMYVTNINNKILLITQNQQVMESVIQRSMSESTENFANNPVFTSLLKKVTGPQLGMIYLDNKQYLAAVSALPLEGATQNQDELTSTLLTNPAYQSSNLSSFTLNDKGLYMEGYTAFDNPQFVTQFGNSSSSFATAVPNDTLLFEEGHNITQLFNVYVTPLLSTLENEFSTSESPIAAIEAFEDATQISIANDIAPLFTQTSAMALHRAESFLVPVALTILTEITNQASAETTMAKLANAMIATVSSETGVPLETPSSEAVNGTTIHSAGQFQGIETLLNYALIQNNKSLAISSSKQGITSVLDILTQPAISLARSPKYPEILKNAPASNSTIYLDIRGVVDGFLPLLSLSFDEETANLYATQVKPYLDVLNNFALYNTRDGDMWKSVAQLQLVN